MSLTQQQLDQLQADLDAVKAAVASDTTAQATVVADQDALAKAQAALAADTDAQVKTAAAVVTTEQQLLADAQADFAAK